MKNILVVNVNWVGDVIFSSPVFKALRTAYPKARISCLAVPRVKAILESIPSIDEVIVYDEDGAHHNPFAKLALIFQLSARKFDVAFLLHRSLTRALLVFLAGVKHRVGVDAKGRGMFLTHKVTPKKEPAHRSDVYLNIIESYGVKVTDRATHLVEPSDARKQTGALLKERGVNENDFVVVINPGGNWDLKRWPARNYSILIKYLEGEFKAKIIITGAAKDIALARMVADYASSEPIILAGQTDLKQLMAVMKRADLVISADSGPLHLANGLGTKTIGIFGPTRPEYTGPRGKGPSVVLQHDVGCNREPCYFLQCSDNVCMQSVTVEDVIGAVRQIKN